MGVMTLDSDLGIEHSVALKETLAEHLQAPQRQVDAGAVERVHTASLQVLAAWWRDRDAAGHRTEWTACSEPLQAAAGTVGLEAALGLDRNTSRQPHAMEDPA